MYKIEIVSTHSAGKTSLGHLVAGNLLARGVTTFLLGETARQAARIGLTLNEGTSVNAQLWILLQQFAHEIEWSTPRAAVPAPEVMVCDRSIDNYAYLRCHLKQDHDYGLSLVQMHRRFYPPNITYLLPVVGEATPDGVRSVEDAYRREIYCEIKDLFARHQYPYIELPVPTATDGLRGSWTEKVVNETLKALGKNESLFMR